MARSDKNLMSLEEFRRELGYHPFHFWGLAGTKAPVKSSCNDCVKEYSWQDSERAGRREIAHAIQSAEEKLLTYLGYSVAPHYVTETINFPKYMNYMFDRYGYVAPDGKWIPVTAKEGKIISGGTEVLEVIGDIRIAFTDTDGDELNDVFDGSIATTVTDEDEICVLFKDSDIPEGEDIGSNRDWEISPINVSISGGFVTVKGRAWQVVKPILYQGVSPDDELDASDSNSYVTELTVYRRYTYSGITTSDSEVAFIWETQPYPYESYGVTSPTITHSLDPHATAIATGRMTLRNSETGTLGIGLATYDATTAQWISNFFEASRVPDRVILRYYAGVERVNRLIDPAFRRCVFAMACAELTKDICACEVANRTLKNWQFDLARTSGAGDEGYGAISRDDLMNPFGTRRGHVYAWKTIKDLSKQTGVAL